jgi:hypothetical protein
VPALCGIQDIKLFPRELQHIRVLERLEDSIEKLTISSSGRMTGIITPDNVVQFRAVPFAAIPARFKQSILRTDLEGTDRDFTKHG